MHLKRKLVLTSALGVLGLSNAFAQGAAPSSHFFYKGPDIVSDITMNQVSVSTTAPYTYFEALGWNNGFEGGGYCGIQDIGNGGRKYIFSLWDPLAAGNTTPIKAAYLGQGTTVSNFGGEGTGLGSSNTDLGWSVNNWYNFVTRTWQVNGHTHFGFWSQDLSTLKWTHLLTMDYPIANVSITTKNDAFEEDWADQGAPIRKALFREAWQRSVSGVWTLQNAVQFHSNDSDYVRNGIYNQAFNAGVENGAFFMQIGGNTTHAFPGRILDLGVPSSAAKPVTVTGEVSAFNAAYNAAAKTIDLTWTVNPLKSPQFSYQFDLFDNAQFTGSPVASSAGNVPQARALSVNVSFVAGGVYYARFKIKDIFDNVSALKTATLTLPAVPVCADPAWNAATAYPGSSVVSYSGYAYTSKWWTQGENPALKSGQFDVWKLGAACKNPTPLPELAIISPLDNSSMPGTAASAWVDVTVNDAFLPIDSVLYTLVDTKTTGMSGVSATRNFKVTYPYDLNYLVLAGQTFTRITAVAYGDNGKPSLPKTVQINYINNAAPAVTVTSPVPYPGNNNATYLVGGSLTVSANVTDADGSVAKVEISRGGGNTVTLTAPPYTATFANLPAPAPDGSIFFNVKAYDNQGATTTALVVAYKNRIPLIAVTAPGAGAAFAPGATVNVTTVATDVDGGIAKVEFFNGAVKLGETSKAPFSFAIAGAAAGTYALTAKATDNLGTSATSSAVSFSVKPSGCSTAAWNAAAAYVAGNRVSKNGTVYEAKWWTQGEDPVLKSGTWDVWKIIGACVAP